MQTDCADVNTPDRVTLYYNAGTSDKVYQAAIEPAGSGLFTVTFAYGRRGATLQTGTKTASPVPYQKARGIFKALVREKTAKGYTPGEDGTPYVGGDKEKCATGIACQLLNPIEENQVRDFLDSPEFAMQEKFDGRRLLLRKENGCVTGINRLGLETGLPVTIAEEAAALRGDFILDGEAVGDVLHVFDVLSVNGTDLRPESYTARLVHLELVLMQGPKRSIRPVHTACSTPEKHEFLERLRQAGKEGAVFKDLRAPYTAGRPNTGGPQVKLKLYETASCIVTGQNDRRSVALGLFAGGEVVPCGNVTIPPGQPLPTVGELVEVRYLYAFPESHALFQPVYLGRREDISGDDCNLAQLKHKAA